MSLRTGTSLITLTLLINKLSGLYGILALLTGLPLNSLQLSMYIYSIFALILTAILAPHVRAQSPLQCLALAWFYLADSIINAAYTAAFGVAWFHVVAQATAPGGNSGGSLIPGASIIDDTSGFTNPEFNVTSVGVALPTPTGQLIDGPGQEAHLVGYAAATTSPTAALGSTILQSGSIASVTVISALWAIRIYFILIVMAYARGVLRQHIVNSSQNPSAHLGSSSSSQLADNPFAKGREEGQGWKGKLGRLMVAVGKGYWLGPDAEGEWVRDIGGRFGKGGPGVGNGRGAGKGGGVVERERRRRAGTGPPLLRPIELGAVKKG